MHQTFDVGVIGGGVAGAAAALAAAAAGARVVVISAAPGASALGGGGWYDAPPASFAAALAAAGLPLVPCAAPLPHPAGELRTCACAATSHAPVAAADAIVVGIAGLPGFRAAALATLWGAALGSTLRHAMLQLEATPPAGWAPVSLAAALERESALLGRPLAELVRRTRAAAVIVPAVLGAHGWQRVHAAIAAAAGVPVAEALAAAPSLPGWRLYGALRVALDAAGVTRITGRAAADDPTDHYLDGVRLHGETATRLAARAWVLATGRYVGGGIVADPAWRETALGMRVRVVHVGAAYERIEPLAMTDAARRSAQPPLHVGVLSDDVGRPVTADGAPRYDNVFAAGDVLAGGQHSLGEAAAAGTRAGTAAARAAA